MSVYANLSRAQLTYEYLHTNSTTHEFLFGALAELVDNSRDADATELRIHTTPSEKFRGGFTLCFLDNGCGMDPVEVSQVIQFGRSSKREAGASHIGQYGNGLKSGSMRIGRDMILFTKKGSSMSCLFISRTFHEKEEIREVIVPMPSWHIKSKAPYLPEGHTKETHDIEVDIITKYSPFNSVEELMEQFDKIHTHGTNVMIYNLKLMDNGFPELDVLKDTKDIQMADPHASEVYDIDDIIQPERVSFRSYISVLYCAPRMKVYIQDVKVRTKKLINILYKPKSYVFTSTRFKKRSEMEAENAEKLARLAEEKAKELTTQAREANSKYKTTSKEDRTAIQIAVSKADQAKFDADVKKRIAEAKRKSAKEAKTLTFTFGFNIKRRRCDGLFIYNCNRLIRMYEKVGPQADGGAKGAGLVGVVDVPYLVLEPTHNKQDFADQKEYKHLLKSMADHMMQYWKDSKIETTGITKFWDDFGYTGLWRDDPSSDQKYKMKRMMGVPALVQCDNCLKWRQLSFSRKNLNDEILENWVCSMNSDSNFSNCCKPEQKINIPVGKLQKEIKNLNEKRAEELRKLQEKLDKKQSEIKKKRQKSPSPEPSPPPRRKQKSPSPEKVALARRSRKTKSPSPPPNRKRKAKSPSPPPKKSTVSPSPRKSKKEKSPSPPPKRNRKTRSPSPVRNKKVANTPKAKDPSRSKSSHDKRKPDPSPRKSTGKKEEVKKNDELTEDVEVLSSAIYPLQCKVEAKMHHTWYAGTVVAYKKSAENTTLRIRVKFEKHSHDKFDKWFYETDPTLRLRDVAMPSEEDATTNMNHSQNEVEMNGEDVKGELLEKVTYLLRRCLCYFRAPDFEKDKREILSLTPQQLRDFPLSTFFDDYERNIKTQLQTTRESLNKRAHEAEGKLESLEKEKTKVEKDLKESKQQCSKHAKTLKELRLGVNVMLRSILNEDEKLDAKDTSENVDIYLKTIVDQIAESNSS